MAFIPVQELSKTCPAEHPLGTSLFRPGARGVNAGHQARCGSFDSCRRAAPTPSIARVGDRAPGDYLFGAILVFNR